MEQKPKTFELVHQRLMEEFPEHRPAFRILLRTVPMSVLRLYYSFGHQNGLRERPDNIIPILTQDASANMNQAD